MLKVPNQFQLLKVVQLFHHGEVPHRISTLDNHGRERIEKTQNNKPQTNMSTYHIYIYVYFPLKKNITSLPKKLALYRLESFCYICRKVFLIAKFLPFHLGKFLTIVPKPEFLATFLEIGNSPTKKSLV